MTAPEASNHSMLDSQSLHLQQVDMLVDDVLGAAVGNHALQLLVSPDDLNQLVSQVILTPDRKRCDRQSVAHSTKGQKGVGSVCCPCDSRSSG